MMREESRDGYESMEFAGVVKRYKRMLSEDRTEFFDVSDFEHIADHYIEKNQLTNALRLAKLRWHNIPIPPLSRLRKHRY